MNHLQIAHLIWREHLKPGSTVIDATIGNGHDTLTLAKLALSPSSGRLYGFDIQKQATQATRERLTSSLPTSLLSRIELIEGSHEGIEPHMGPADLIVFNLGYLPGHDKQITTLTESTLRGLEKALQVISTSGLISITCYPGHEEGEKETKAIMEHLKGKNHNDLYLRRFDSPHSPKSPILLLLCKNRAAPLPLT